MSWRLLDWMASCSARYVQIFKSVKAALLRLWNTLCPLSALPTRYSDSGCAPPIYQTLPVMISDLFPKAILLVAGSVLQNMSMSKASKPDAVHHWLALVSNLTLQCICHQKNPQTHCMQDHLQIFDSMCLHYCKIYPDELLIFSLGSDHNQGSEAQLHFCSPKYLITHDRAISIT